MEEPHFIEINDADDRTLPLPIFVTRDRDERDKRLQVVTFIHAWHHGDLDEEKVKAYVEGEITLDEFLGRT